MSKPLKIVVTGPECTGKSSLCTELARELNEPWVPEFAVEYLNNLDRTYRSEDLVKIAEGQLRSIAENEQHASNVLIIDTGLEVIDIWHRDKIGHPPGELKQLLKDWNPDLYLLCKPDIPYEPHPLREDPHRREVLFQQYLEKLEGKPVVLVRGEFSERMDIALQAIRKLKRDG